MSQTEKTVEGEPDYQLGGHDIDLSGSIADDDDVMEFNYESAAIFKRLADDIYTSPEAGLREPLTNSITTSRRVMRNGDCDNPVITITVMDGDQTKLRLRDMGEGISKSVLEDVLLYIGRSTARDDGELSGQYGMGFLASYKLVGMNGGFIMYTNPRYSSEGPYRGLFKPGAFEPDNDGELPELLDDDEYGTVFEYFLKPDISVSDIRTWVENHAKFSPIPIIYKEIDEDGYESYNEDFYAPNLKDAYEDVPCLRIDTPYYEATTSPAADNDIVLISSPVEMYGTRALRKNLPWSVDLRIKHENGLVINGPHEGLIPTTEKAYENMDDNRKEKHVPKTKLSEDALTLPEATGTRERVRKNKPFLQHVNNQLHQQYLDIVEETLDSFNPSTKAMEKMDEMEKNVLLRLISHFDDEDEEYTLNDVKTKFEKQYDYENPDEDLVEFILTMSQSVRIISQPKTWKSRYPTESVYKLSKEDKDIYMCTSASNSWKYEAVEISPEDTEIITVNKASEYDSYSKHLGWEPLKNIKKSNAAEKLNLTDEEIENLSSSSKTTSENVDEKQLTVHHASGGRNTLKVTAQNLIEAYDSSVSTFRQSRYGDVLLLFPQGSDYKISNNYDLADKKCCVASCSKKVSDYLVDNSDRIMLYEDYREWVGSQTVYTSYGTANIENVIHAQYPVVLTPKDNPKNSSLNDDSILSKMKEYIHEKYNYQVKPEYGILETNMFTHLQSAYNEEDVNHIRVLETTDSIDNQYMTRSYHNEVRMYGKIRLTDEQFESQEMSVIMDSYNCLNEQVIMVIENMLNAYESMNNKFVSNKENEENIRMPTVKTKFGEMRLDEVYNYVSEDNVILHALHPKNISAFEQKDILENGGEYIQEHYEIESLFPHSNKNTVYVPILNTEYERVRNVIPNDTTVISSDYHRNTYKVNPKYVYANIKLMNFDSDNIPRRVINNKNFNDVKNIVDMFSKLQNLDGENNALNEEMALVNAQNNLRQN